MVNLVVSEKYNDKKLSKFIFDTFPKLSFNEFQKALRKKDIKINNTRINKDCIINADDKICLFIVDSILYGIEQNIDVIYEDKNILIINKPTGIPVLNEKNTLGIMDMVENYYKETSIVPKPCHRLDTNTSGLLIISKTEEANEIMLSKFKKREIRKFYKATVYGIPKIKEKTLTAFLFKDSKKNQVYISNEKKQGYVEIITKYKVISENKKNKTSVLEVELITR